MNEIAEHDRYERLVEEIVEEIHRARTLAVSRSNALVIELYWRIGQVILSRQVDEGYGTRLIERLSADLTSRFPGQRGFSPRNLRYMRAFAAAWPDEGIVQNVLHNLGWGQIQLLLDRLDDTETRLWYARRALADGWTHGILSDRLNAQLHLREGTAPSNFPATAPDADPAVLDRLATDPYRLDFLALQPGVKERQLEAELVSRITDFLTHLGTGFAYLGRQYRIEVGDTEFFLDLLFYNTRLHRYIVFEIKAQPFQPGHVGQLSFYVTAIERHLRSDQDHPTIGVLLVPAKDRIVVEYALASIDNPMTVATYTYADLPSDVRTELPATDQFIELVEDVTHPDHRTDESPD